MEYSHFILKQRQAHVIATDSHNAERRPPILSSAVEVAAHILACIKKIPKTICLAGRDSENDLTLSCDAGAAEAMVTENPYQILNGKPLDMPEPVETSQKKGRWKRLFGRKYH